MRPNDNSLPPSAENYLNTDFRLRSWFFTHDHKRIALLFLVSITSFSPWRHRRDVDAL